MLIIFLCTAVGVGVLFSIFIMYESVVTHLSSSCLSFTVPSCLNLTSLHAMSVAVYMQYELHLIVQTVTELSRPCPAISGVLRLRYYTHEQIEN